MLPWQPNQEADQHYFSYFELLSPKQHLHQIRVIMLHWFWCCPLNNSFFFNLMLPWQPNKMVTGHKTHNLGRQSSKDHTCQIWFISLYWLWRKCNLTIFPLKAYGSFLLPWQPNQEAEFSQKRQE